MVIKILYVRVPQWLSMYKDKFFFIKLLFITTLFFCSLALTNALAENSLFEKDAGYKKGHKEDGGTVFFEKGFATSPFGEEHAKGQRNRSKTQKLREYQEKRLDNEGVPESERVRQARIEHERLKAEKENNYKERLSKRELELDRLKGERSKKEGRTDSSVLESDQEIKNITDQVKPISLKDLGPVEIAVFISGEPKTHLFKELNKIIKAKELRGVKFPEVSVIGRPFSDKKFAKLMLKLKPKETPIRYLLALPKDITFKYSPVWLVTQKSGVTTTFEGDFPLEAVLE